MSRYSRIASALFSASVLVSLLSGSACSSNECDHDGERGPCTGPTSHDVCIGGEGQYHFSTRACATGQKCVEFQGKGSCLDVAYGAACTTRETCGELDCRGGTCGGSSSAVDAWCASVIDVPPSQTATLWISTFHGTLPPAPGVFGPNLVPSACGAPAGGVQLVRLTVPEAPRGTFRGRIDAVAEDGSGMQLATYVRGCDGLQSTAPIPCNDGGSLEVESFNEVPVMIAARDANASPIPYVLTVVWKALP